MTIRLKPELEALVKKDVERGPYESVDEFVAYSLRDRFKAACGVT
jgi:Arc/MetJ-type ribon-helix-helix transcriptional regulator